MCSSFTWGTVSVHYLLGLPLAYALRSATPNGLMLVKLTYSPMMLRRMDSFYFPRCSILSPSSLVHCVLFTPLPHDTLSCSIFRLLCALLPSVPHTSPSRHTVLLYLPSFVCPVAVSTKLIPIPRAPFAAGINRICVQYGYSPLVLLYQQFSNVLSNLVLYPTRSAFQYLFCRLVPQSPCLLFPRIPCRLR